MTDIQGGAFEVPKHRRLLAILGVAMVLFLGLWVTKGPVQQASAYTSKAFCQDVWLQPYGQGGDRCSAGKDNWGRIVQVWVHTHQRAGCVNYHGWHGEFYEAWQCVGSNTSSIKQVPQNGGSYIGIIRNNNLSYGGKFSGSYLCCWP